MKRHETDRWRGVTAVVFLAAAVGVLVRSPAPLLVGVVAVAVAGYAAFAGGRPPEPTLTVEREVSETDPDSGEDVTVTVTVHNEGEFLPDVRVVDGVPEPLNVVDGSPRHATALRSGRHATFSYTVEAVRGEHTFDDATVLVRDVAGTTETEVAVGPDAETTVRCLPMLASLDRFPLRGQASERVGRIAAGVGSGTEFHATREYRPGDPLARIDWNRMARSGDLATVEFREEQSAPVVVLVDTRVQVYVDDSRGVSAVDHAVHAAGGVVSALLDAGDRVGVAGFGPRWTYLAPSLGRDHRHRVRETLATGAAFAPTPPEEQFLPTVHRRRLRKRLPSGAQLVCCTPLVDDYVVTTCRRFEAHGYPVTVVSPDVTGGDDPGATLARVERRQRVRELRGSGVPVVDWNPTDPLVLAVRAAERGWRNR
ncbi:DUF58 domain-containing protein [Halospeciosus flavus]|uniref:DUF58 domain-containing protein n=1 Tax=Halospeciosus flavus TaxID=3032283 RepID=A0ABD5Z5S7_9EURY|nr:DUF58 domain-containing protein [Halospeciosus flavus]